MIGNHNQLKLNNGESAESNHASDNQWENVMADAPTFEETQATIERRPVGELSAEEVAHEYYDLALDLGDGFVGFKEDGNRDNRIVLAVDSILEHAVKKDDTFREYTRLIKERGERTDEYKNTLNSILTSYNRTKYDLNRELSKAYGVEMPTMANDSDPYERFYNNRGNTDLEDKFFGTRDENDSFSNMNIPRIQETKRAMELRRRIQAEDLPVKMRFDGVESANSVFDNVGKDNYSIESALERGLLFEDGRGSYTPIPPEDRTHE